MSEPAVEEVVNAPKEPGLLDALLTRIGDAIDSVLSPIETPVFGGILDLFRPINQWLNCLPPSAWHLAAVGLFAVSALAVILVPRSYIYAGAPDKGTWRDLRVWTVLSLLPYMAAYYFLP